MLPVIYTILTCRAQFFLDNYEAVWSPPPALRREVEEAVYQSLVNRRIAAGEVSSGGRNGRYSC